MMAGSDFWGQQKSLPTGSHSLPAVGRFVGYFQPVYPVLAYLTAFLLRLASCFLAFFHHCLFMLSILSRSVMFTGSL